MTIISPIAVGAVLVTLVHSHFVFSRLAVNDVWQLPTRFIRNKTYPFEEISTPNTNVNTRMYLDPTYISDITNSIRCGRDNLAHAVETEVLEVFAGDTIEVAHQRREPQFWEDRQWYGCPDDRGTCDPALSRGYMDINHQGPFLAHLSKVPDGQDVHTYDGSGDWTKIYRLGFEMRDPSLGDPVHWLAHNDQLAPGRFRFNIPTQTPAGEYLLRLDLIWASINATGYPSSTQLYPSCAHILVKNDAIGTLPQGIRIPEDLNAWAPGMTVSLEMYRSQSVDVNYTYPAGLLWDGVNLIVDTPNI